MALTCGGCYHFRGGKRCRNKKAATYNAYFDPNSQGCQMHVPRFLLPFGFGISAILGIIIVPLQIILLLTSGGSGSSSSSNRGGFRL